MTKRVAVDIGGTFTDLAAVDGSGRLTLAKTDTTPSSPDRGAVHALEQSGLAPADITTFVHGTTVVINAVTERKGATTALLTTEGFRDVLEIGRANRPDLYNLAYRKPPPFVPRRRRFEVRERRDHRGRELTPLDETALPGIAERIRASGSEALAICFLHAWADPAHERRAAEALRPLLPEIAIVCSHEVSGEWREFERSSTAVLSAASSGMASGSSDVSVGRTGSCCSIASASGTSAATVGTPGSGTGSSSDTGCGAASSGEGLSRLVSSVIIE